MLLKTWQVIQDLILDYEHLLKTEMLQLHRIKWRVIYKESEVKEIL